MTADRDPREPTFYTIRVSGRVGKRLLGTSSGLEAVSAPECTVLQVESEGGAAEIAAHLRARGLEVLTIWKVG